MTRLVLIRHGPTAWNEAGLIQGRRDIPLSVAGRRMVETWHIPEAWRAWRWMASPLIRARTTAAMLTCREIVIDARLMEMDWGAFEGRSLASLRAADTSDVIANEAQGLDFRPPGGESPREVAARLRSFVAELAQEGEPVVALTHKGVLRAALVLATGWDMRTKPPLRLARDSALSLICRLDGGLVLDGPPRRLGAA